MTHLGSWVSALADGQLTGVQRERALAHVAACDDCAAELAAARAARDALASCADVCPAPDLTARLLSVAPPEPQLPPRAPEPDPFRVPRSDLSQYEPVGGFVRRTWSSRTGSPLRGEVAPRRLPVRLAVGSVAGVGAVASLLFVLGARPDVVPVSHPGSDLFLLGQAPAAGLVTPAQDETTGGTWAAKQGWTVPDALPSGWTVTGTRWSADGTVLEVDLTGPSGVAVLTEQQGRLADDVIRDAQRSEIGGREVVVLSTEPWHVAWQTGSCVVQVVTTHGGDLDALVAAFPASDYADDVPTRLARGWSTVSEVLDRP